MTFTDQNHQHGQRWDPFQPGLLNKLGSPPRKILILRASRIGDFINAGPAFRALRRNFPAAQIDLITLPMLFDLAVRLKLFDHIIPFPGYPGLAEQFFSPAQALAFFESMQAAGYDLAIQMQGSGVYSNPFILMCGARYSAGFVRDGDSAGLLDAALPFPPLHEALRNMRLIEFLGAAGEEPRPEFPLLPQDHATAAGLLQGHPHPWIGIHISARDSTRRWPVQRFTSAAVQLQHLFGGTIILIGEECDRGILDNSLPGSATPYLDLAGRTNLPVTGAVINQLGIFLTNDTGPAHMAYALNTPTVTIFGGGDPARNGPITNGPFRVLALPIDCRPCETGRCSIGLRCLDQINVETVVQAASEMMRLRNNEI